MEKREEKEEFTLKIPSLNTSPMGNVGYSVLSLIISGLLLSGVVKMFSMYGVLVLLVLSVLVFVIITSATGDGVALSLPSSVYPLPPNLGRDGVSSEVRNSA
jgi:hypothetical protein|tara:strand:- start:556 stop:861 length:306 start_codon:yes stop_codon:yes gene_type:complete